MSEGLDALFPDLDVDEQLFHGLVEGSLQDYEGLLKELEEVDVSGVGQRTLLHVAVKVGNLEWVEALLNMGADPGLKDRDHSNAVEIGRRMEAEYPGDVDRREILDMLSLIQERGGKSDSSRGERNRYIDKSRGVTPSPSLREVTPFDGRTDDSTPNEVPPSKTISLVLEAISNWQRKRVDLKGGGSVDQLSALTVGVESFEDRVRLDCIHGMVQKTEIVAEKRSEIRGIYEYLYSTGSLTSSILDFLRHQPGVKISIHSDPGDVLVLSGDANVRGGVERLQFEGELYSTFADFADLRVHFGGGILGVHRETASFLVMPLAQMAVHISFRNGGRPYEQGNELGEEQYGKIIDKAEGDLREGQGLDEILRWALSNGNQLIREVELIGSVPRMVAYHGSASAKYVLRKQLPSLIKYYERHVMPKLLDPLNVGAR